MREDFSEVIVLSFTANVHQQLNDTWNDVQCT